MDGIIIRLGWLAFGGNVGAFLSQPKTTNEAVYVLAAGLVAVIVVELIVGLPGRSARPGTHEDG